MKFHEIFYLIGIFLIVASVAYFYLSTSTLSTKLDGTITNLINEKGSVDSALVPANAAEGIYQTEVSEKKNILCLTVPLGIILLIIGFYLKRKIEGRDLFIDDEDENIWE